MTRNVQRLVDGALHSSVTADRLTTRKFGMMMGKLYSQPLVEYLEPSERPQFIIDLNGEYLEFSGLSAPEPPNASVAGTTKGLFTDERLVLVAGNTDGDQVLSIPLDDITGIDIDSGFVTDGLTLETERGTLKMRCVHPTEASDLSELSEFLIECGGCSESDRNETDAFERIGQFVSGARDDLVDRDRLTSLKRDPFTRLLHSKPLASYLEPSEQPQFVLDTTGEQLLTYDGPDAPSAPVPSDDATGLHCLTDQRWLAVTPNPDGDVPTTIPLETITGVATDSDERTVTVSTEEYHVQFHCNKNTEIAEIEAIKEYLRANTSADGDGPKPVGRPIDFHLDASPQGEWVTEQRIHHLEDALDPEEPVHYVLYGPSLRLEGAGPDDKGWNSDVYTAFTDTRVVAQIKQKHGDDLREIPYSALLSCDLDITTDWMELFCNTAAATYTFRLHEPNEAEVKAALSFIRSQRQTQTARAKERTTENDDEAQDGSLDPTEQLKNLSELYDAGILSESEFETKKQELLEKI